MENITFLFTGQGAQYAGMGSDLYEKHESFKNVFDEAGEHLKVDLKNICSDENELAKTDNAQKAIFAVSYGIYETLKKHGIVPNRLAGFSLGEMTSFAASGMLGFKDALDLISARGSAMQKACDHTPGAMFGIIGADDAYVEEVCEHISKTAGYVVPANYNCPKQVVISGETEAVEKAAAIFGEKKIRTVKLNVAGAYHSKLMRYAEGELIDFLASIDFGPPKIELYSNLTGERLDCGKSEKREKRDEVKSFMVDYIPKHMSSPVRFKNEIENISAQGCDMYIELGAGRVLSGFVKKICEDAKITNIQNTQNLESVFELFHVKQLQP